LARGLPSGASIRAWNHMPNTVPRFLTPGGPAEGMRLTLHVAMVASALGTVLWTPPSGIAGAGTADAVQGEIWASWRHAETATLVKAERTSFCDVSNSRESVLPTEELFRSCSDVFMAASKAVDWEGPAVRQVAESVSQIFVLCISCDKVVVPRLWLNKTFLVNGQSTDRCLAAQNRTGVGEHWQKVTWAHQLMAFSGLFHNHSSIAVFEEDADLAALGNASSLEEALVPAGQDWDALRFEYYPVDTHYRHYFQNMPLACCYLCHCRARGAKACVLDPGCQGIHGSAAYALSRAGMAKVVNTKGIIDVEVFAAVRSLLPLPQMIVQKRYPEREVFQDFRNFCVG